MAAGMNSNALNGRQFREHRRVQGYLKKGVNSDFAMTILASESSTVCFVISSSICYWLFKCRVLSIMHRVCVCVCVCVCVRGTGSHHSGVYSPSEIVLTAACVLQIHTSINTVCHWTLFPFGAWTGGKTNLKTEAHDYGKGHYISDTHACGVLPITMYWVSWPIRANCACWKDRLCIKLSFWERRGIEDLQ